MLKQQTKILCVDDEKNVLNALLRFFMDDDYEIATASSGEEGLKVLAEEGPFQIIISDYRMPVMNGVDFLKEVYERWPDTVRIVLSGYADAGAIVAAINEGHIYKFIPKPWNDEELRFTISSSIERYNLQQRNCELLAALSKANEELELKVMERTEGLELRNTALLFSQQMLNALPVGVVGIDVNGMIAHCNQVAFDPMKQLCGDFLGADINQSCNLQLLNLVGAIKENDIASEDLLIGNKSFRVIGKKFVSIDSEAIVLTFLEHNP